MNATYSNAKFSHMGDPQDSNSLHSDALQTRLEQNTTQANATCVVFRSMLLLMPRAHFALRTASLADLIQFAGPLPKPYMYTA